MTHSFKAEFVRQIFIKRKFKIMGIVFGKTGSAEPTFTLLKATNGYEIRSYPHLFTASVKMPENAPNNAFNLLAKYIGVFGEPENRQRESLAMTAPVLTTEIKDKKGENEEKFKTMAFVLPFNKKRINECPSPTDKRVSLEEIPSETVAVIKFSGWYSDDVGKNHFKKLKDLLRDDNIINIPENNEDFMVAQYHPPFTLPFLRRNEIWVKLPKSATQQVERSDK